MYSKIFLNIILASALAVIQLFFISGLPGWANSLNLILVALIFILSFAGLREALWIALTAGFLADIFSFYDFGLYILSFIFTVAATYFLLINFFTNRSLYSFLALTFFSSIIYEFFLNLINYFFQFSDSKSVSSLMDFDFWFFLTKGTILNLLAALIIFYVLNFISNKFKPVFLVRRKS